MSSGKKPNRRPSEGAAYPTPEATPAPETPNGSYRATAEDERSRQPAAQGSTTEQVQNSNSSHSKSATPGSEQPATSEGTAQPAQNPDASRSKSATPAPDIPNWGYKVTVEDEPSEQPAAPGSTTKDAQNSNSSHSKSATHGPEQPAASGSSPQQVRRPNDPHSKSATPSSERPATSKTKTHHSEEPNGRPDPNIPLPSIEDETGQEMLYKRRRAAVDHVLMCEEKDFWAMLGLNPAHTTQMQAANTYRRLSFLVHPDKQENEHKEKAAKAQARLNQAKQSEGYKKALPTPEQPVPSENETFPQPGSEEFRTEDKKELELRPLFAKPKKVRFFQEKFFDQKAVLKWVTQLSTSENPNYGYDQARMNLRIVNNTLIVTNIKNKRPADENLIDIDGLAAYFIRARLAREPETAHDIREQFERFVKDHHYPTAWVDLIKAPPDVNMHTGRSKTHEDTGMTDAPETRGEEEVEEVEEDDDEESGEESGEEDDEEDSTDPGFKAGYTPLGEMIVAHRKVGRDGYQFLVATGHQDCPFYQLRPASDYLRTVADAYFECQHAKQLTNTPLQGRYKGILHWAEEYSRPGALKKPVGVGRVAFHDKGKPEWAYRTIIEKFQKSRRGVDEAIELCKKREAKIRVKFYAKLGIDLPKPDYRQGLDERRQAKQRQDSNMFDPTSFSSFVCWWEKKNDIDLVKNPDKMSEMMGKWTAMQAAMS